MNKHHITKNAHSVVTWLCWPGNTRKINSVTTVSTSLHPTLQCVVIMG